jgi:hypothetical protein
VYILMVIVSLLSVGMFKVSRFVHCVPPIGSGGKNHRVDHPGGDRHPRNEGVLRRGLTLCSLWGKG